VQAVAQETWAEAPQRAELSMASPEFRIRVPRIPEFHLFGPEARKALCPAQQRRLSGRLDHTRCPHYPASSGGP
jgi:hypothetical protein